MVFAAKLRCQGDCNDDAMRVRLQLYIDCQPVGSVGIQRLWGRIPQKFISTSVSQRTLSSSFLSAGPRALAPGKHTLSVAVHVEVRDPRACIRHLSVYNDDPIIVWFG